jgi:hypothetical protein
LIKKCLASALFWFAKSQKPSFHLAATSIDPKASIYYLWNATGGCNESIKMRVKRPLPARIEDYARRLKGDVKMCPFWRHKRLLHPLKMEQRIFNLEVCPSPQCVMHLDEPCYSVAIANFAETSLPDFRVIRNGRSPDEATGRASARPMRRE